MSYGAPRSSRNLRKPQEALGGTRSPQEAPGGPRNLRKPQGSPREAPGASERPRRPQEAPGRSRKPQEAPEVPFAQHTACIWQLEGMIRCSKLHLRGEHHRNGSPRPRYRRMHVAICAVYTAQIALRAGRLHGEVVLHVFYINARRAPCKLQHARGLPFSPTSNLRGVRRVSEK